LSNTLGRLVEVRRPNLALFLNGANIEARVNHALQMLANEETPIEEQPFLKNLKSALSVAPGDARVYTLLGEYLLRTRQPDQANQMFRQTLKINKGEVNALEKVARRQIEDRDIAGGFASLNILLTRWPARLASVADLMEKVITDPQGLKAVISELSENPPWRISFLDALARAPNANDFLSEIVLGLVATPAPPTPHETRIAITALMANGKANAAYRVFLFTLPAAAQKLAGHVFNPQFVNTTTGQVFDWEFVDSPGVEISRTARGGLTISLLNGPVRLIRFGQTLALIPGAYVFKTTVSGQSLALPRGLSLRIYCPGARTEIAKIDLPEGQFSRMDLAAEFRVPDDGCASQRISIISGLNVDSWRYRYNGKLQLHSLDIEQAAQ